MIGFIQRRFLTGHHRCPALKILDARSSKLQPHQARNRTTNDPCAYSKDQIEGADVLVVSRHEPPGEKARLVVRVMMVMRMKVCTCGCNGCHPFGLFT